MQTVILSLGGSMVIQDQVNVSFLKDFTGMIIRYGKDYPEHRLVIVVGGGSLARHYHHAATQVTFISEEELDWIGIMATRLNAELLRVLFSSIAAKEVIHNPTQPLKGKEKLFIASGWKPGCSTDYDAVLLAANVKAKTIINATNVAYVYDKDPKIYHHAKPLKQMSWSTFTTLVGQRWSPGLNMPFDPVASKKAQALGLTVYICGGQDLANLKNALYGKPFKGTIISK
ncbi:UMP kinase [Candidatus Woesearchaeota archaeon]|nr:UMP kinase [Candidatus Woesearchaeota archaeon]